MKEDASCHFGGRLVVVVLLLKVSWTRDGWELELEPELWINVDINQSISNVSTRIIPITRG